MINKVIQLYIYEVFEDIDSNGVDLFEGWEGSEQTRVIMDTADPLVIARYWLIRWIVNIASSSLVEEPIPGSLLFRSVSPLNNYLFIQSVHLVKIFLSINRNENFRWADFLFLNIFYLGSFLKSKSYKYSTNFNERIYAITVGLFKCHSEGSLFD
jgi:hypothetical protein